MKMKKLITMLAIACLLSMVSVVPQTFAAALQEKAVTIHGDGPYMPIYDEDAMGSDDADGLATQQSIKAYSDSGTQTVTNKTLTSPTINTPTITTPTITGTASHAGDYTISDEATGGNLGARNQLQGLPKLKVVTLGAMTDGTGGVTLTMMDDTPTGEFTEVDAGTAVLLTADATYARVGTKSLKIALTAAAVAGDGATDAITQDFEDEESLGFWCYSDTGLTAGDMSAVLTDDGGARTYTFPVIAAGVWTWVELDISALTGGTGDVITALSFLLTTQGATNLAATNVYLDGAWVWDLDDEETLGVKIVQDGVLSVWTSADATANTGAHTASVLAENTDYFIHYQASADAIVTITNQSAKSAVALIATQ